MIRIAALRICLTVMALLFSASASMAATCADDPNECTPKNLCEIATALYGGNTSWSNASSKAKHVTFAKSLGMGCGVTASLDPCDSDPNKCKISQLCEKATKSINGQTFWNSAAQGYVDVAIEYELTCDFKAENAAVKKVCSQLTPEFCRASFVCAKATTISSNKKIWRSPYINYEWTAFLKEAKKRGLTCGVKAETSTVKKTCSKETPEACANIKLCEIATFGGAGLVKWNYMAIKREAVTEAKKRGLTCGVKAKTTAVKKVCTRLKLDGCTDEFLCKVSTRLRGDMRVWSNKNTFYEREAKKRGLACGVKVEVKKTCSVISPEVCNISQLCLRATKGGEWTISPPLKPYAKEAKKRGLTCGVKNLTHSELAIKAHQKLCPSSGIGASCFGTQTNSDGNKWIGRRVNRKLHGVATLLIKGDVKVGYRNENDKWSGDHLYVWHTGQARFWWNYDSGKSYKSNSTVNEVFPSLRAMFNAQSKQNRITIQRSLSKKGLYSSSIDGAWGRNTLIGLARFAAEHLNTINLKSTDNIELLLSAAKYQSSNQRTKIASLRILEEVAKRDASTTNVAAKSSNFKGEYRSQSALKRKQLQYALKKLGFYFSSVDGLWGKGTNSALVEYAKSNGVGSNSPSSVFSSILRKVDVPSSFTVAKQPSSSSSSASSSGSNFLKKLVGGLIVVGVCSTTPNAAACLDGALDTAAGSNSNNGSSRSSPNTSPSSSSASSDKQCSYDGQCGFRGKCIKRAGKSMCVKLVDEDGRKIRDRNAEPIEDQCRRNSDCPRKFECNRQFRICVAK